MTQELGSEEKPSPIGQIFSLHERWFVPEELLVVSVVGVAAGQQQRSGKSTRLNPGQQRLTERFYLRLEQKRQNKAKYGSYGNMENMENSSLSSSLYYILFPYIQF